MSTPALLVVTCLASSAHGFQAHGQGADGPWWPSTAGAFAVASGIEPSAPSHRFATGDALACDGTVVREGCGEGPPLRAHRVAAFTGVLGTAAEPDGCSAPRGGPLALVLLAMATGGVTARRRVGWGPRGR